MWFIQHERVFLGVSKPPCDSSTGELTDVPAHVVLKVVRDDSHELAMVKRMRTNSELAVVPVLGVIPSFARHNGGLVSAIVMPRLTPLSQFVESTCVTLGHMHIVAVKLVKVYSSGLDVHVSGLL